MSENASYIAIPLEVKAMLTPEGQKQEYAGLVMNYSVIGSHHRIAPTPESHPFTTKKHERIGVHLHWVMPDYLTHGEVKDKGENGDVSYPSLPDRWLVTRFWWDAELKDRSGKPEEPEFPVYVKRFIIQSNCLEKNRESGKYNQDSPSYPVSKDSAPEYRFLGRSAPCGTEWKEPDEPDGWLEHLTAVAPGAPYFAAYYPYCKNVFGFYDELLDNEGKPLVSAELCYSVVGWYCKPEKVKNHKKDGMPPPEHSVYHGMIYGMHWPVLPEDNPYYITSISEEVAKSRSEKIARDRAEEAAKGKTEEVAKSRTVEVATGRTVEVATGNSSAEALSALQAGRVDALGESAVERGLHLLLQDNGDTLERQDGVLETERNLHRLGFGVHSTPYVVGRKPAADAEKKDTGSLNALFSQLDEYNQKLALLGSMKEECARLGRGIYEHWCVLSHLKATHRTACQDNLIKKIRAMLEELSKIEKECEQFQVNTKDLLKFPTEPFWTANNPAVLFKGLERSFSYGYDGRFSADDSLLLRKADQILSQLRVTISGASIVLLADKLISMPSLASSELPEAGELTKCINALACETLLLCPSLAPLLARRFAKNTDKDIDKDTYIAEVSNRIRQLQLTAQIGAFSPSGTEGLAKKYKFTGELPSKIAISCYHSDWAPLLMEWEISYHPDKNVLKKQPDLSNWQLGDIDFTWIGDTPPALANPVRLSGRSPITPHAAETMKSMAAKLGLNDAAKYGLIDVLSQLMGDFHSQLLMRAQYAATPIYNNSESDHMLTDEVRTKVERYVEHIPSLSGIFSPIRAGFMEIHSLRVIDSFGKFCLVRPEKVYRSEALRHESKPYGKLIMLPPRIMQPARLNVVWAGGKRKPVSAWLVHNHADKNLAIYAPEGSLLGFLQLTKHDGSTVWVSAPFAQGQEPVTPEDLDKDLHKFVQFFTDRGKNGYGHLEDFLDILDTALERVNHNGSAEYRAMCSFAGRPAALAAADIELELSHRPVRFPEYIQEHSTPGVKRDIKLETTKFPVSIGDPHHHNDGLIGFFDKEFCGFHSHHPRHGGKCFWSDPVITLSPRSLITPLANTPGGSGRHFFLMDPLADIHFTSGLLPRVSVGLPDEAVARDMDAIRYTLFAAPVFSSESEISLPVPGSHKGDWAWLTPGREMQAIHKATEQALFSDRPQIIMEGWMSLLESKEGEKP